MPKMKSNRLLLKKVSLTAKGKVKRTKGNRSHKTSTRSSKRMRRLKGTEVTNPTHDRHLQRMLPYKGKGGK